MPDETIIELKRSGLWLMTVGAWVVAGFGVWFLVIDTEIIGRTDDPGILHGIGLLFTLLTGLVGFGGIRKLRQSSVGLTLTHDGLTDTSSGVAAGFVPWSDVTGIDGYEVAGQRFITVQVRNPERYLDRGSVVARSILEANFKAKGTPVIIPVKTLRIYADELWALINGYFDEHNEDR